MAAQRDRHVMRGIAGNSLLTRVGGVTLLTSLVVGAAAVVLSGRIIAGQRHQDLMRRAELVGATQADALSGPLRDLDTRSIQRMIDALSARDPGIRSIAVFENDGKAPLARVETSADDGSDRVLVERPITLDDHEGRRQTVGRLRIAYSTAEVWQATRDALGPVIGLLALSLAGAIGALGVTLNRVVLRPLRRLTRLAGALAQGDYSARVATGRGDEVGALADGFNRMAETVHEHTRKLESRVQERTEALAATNHAIMGSINCAQLIQSSILPTADTLEVGLTEHCLLWRPRDVVSGDFYLCREIPGGFVVAVADCTGHGVPGAFMTMTASAMLNNALDLLGAGDPATVLAAVDRKVRAALHQEHAARTTAEQFDNGLDLALCHVVPDEGRLVYAGARIPLLIADSNGVTEVRGDRRSLGYRRRPGSRSAEPAGVEADAVFTNHDVILQPDQTFVLWTDGLTDQNGGEQGRSFGKERLRSLLLDGGRWPLDRLKAELEHSLDHFQGDREQRDDITLFAFRVRLTDAALQIEDGADNELGGGKPAHRAA